MYIDQQARDLELWALRRLKWTCVEIVRNYKPLPQPDRIRMEAMVAGIFDKVIRDETRDVSRAKGAS